MKGDEVFKKLVTKKQALLKEQALLQSEIAAKYPLYAALKYPKPVALPNLPLLRQVSKTSESIFAGSADVADSGCLIGLRTFAGL